MRTRLLSIALGLALPLAAWAVDPPGRVGRLAEVRGSAWLSTAAGGERASAPVNRPLTQGDRLSTDVGARLAVQIGSAELRLAERSDITFTRLDDTHIEVMLAAGSLSVRVREPELAREVLVRTPDATLAPQGEGLARVDRFGRGSYAWAVEGRWQVQAAQGGWQMLNAGQRLELWRDAAGREQIAAASLPHEGDAFERWAQEGDTVYATQSDFVPEVSPEMTGVQDLNRYGSWRDSDDYGSIWFPSRVAVGWSPYSMGQWAWVAPWGWTWVDAMPWGFAPFHYGRWVYIGNQWGWTPGAYSRRPIYAPALAGAVSGVFNNNPGTRPSGVWRPLAPGQAYVPTYRASSGYRQTLNAPMLGGAMGGALGGLTATPRPMATQRPVPLTGQPNPLRPSPLIEAAPAPRPQSGLSNGGINPGSVRPYTPPVAPPARMVNPNRPQLLVAPSPAVVSPQPLAPPREAPRMVTPTIEAPNREAPATPSRGDDRTDRGRIIR